MASSSKDLSVLGSTLEIPLGVSLNGLGYREGVLHYIAGTGTILLEGTLDGINWFTLVDNDNAAIAAKAAVGVTRFPVGGYTSIRARNTVVGVANRIALGFN